MLTPIQKKELEKQQYRLVGSHSAVKVCGWTKKLIRNEGGCYKLRFYGIRSHQCLQMTTSMFCANRCIFCWRGEKAPVSKEWYGDVDDPYFIINNSIKQHLDLLKGFKGLSTANKQYLEESNSIKHVALSLTGEPITYPLLNSLLEELHKRGISTFLVTNGQFPEHLENLNTVTQLYISLDAPGREKLKDIDRPLFKDYYGRLLKSLDIMAKKQFRTCIRITIIKGINDTDLEGYKELIERAEPDFIEVKAYMNVGASTHFLEQKNMPFHKDIKEVSEKLSKLLNNYEILDEHEPSRVVCFIKKSLKNRRYINFTRFFELVKSKKTPNTEDYSSEKMH